MKKTNWILTGLVMLGLATGCASKEKIEGTAAAPAATGKAIADKASNGATDLKLKVEHLAQPERVSSGATDYIVWIQPEGSSTFQNVGVLKVDDDLEAEYETTIPYEKFRVLVTPESDRMAALPSGPVVFEQKMTR